MAIVSFVVLKIFQTASESWKHQMPITLALQFGSTGNHSNIIRSKPIV